MAGKLKVTQIRSGIGRPQDQRQTLKGLGLTRMHKSVVLKDTQSIRGMIRKVQHLVAVEPSEAE
jgi:large subunit ribosomal protein L30